MPGVLRSLSGPHGFPIAGGAVTVGFGALAHPALHRDRIHSRPDRPELGEELRFAVIGLPVAGTGAVVYGLSSAHFRAPLARRFGTSLGAAMALAGAVTYVGGRWLKVF